MKRIFPVASGSSFTDKKAGPADQQAVNQTVGVYVGSNIESLLPLVKHSLPLISLLLGSFATPLTFRTIFD